jgi:hypothetical protein
MIGCGLHDEIRKRNKYEMQERKSECEKKGKKQKYLKYFYEFCVKF